MERRRGEYLQTYVALHTIGLFALALAFSPETKKEVWDRAKGKCEDCGTPLLPGNRKCHHIRPQHMGVDDSVENGIYLCKPCELEAHAELYRLYGSPHDLCASRPPRPKGSAKAGNHKKK